MMRHKGLPVLLVWVMVALAVLACGFPLPAGTTTMAVTKAVCAQDESAESCQARQDAYQLMSQLQSAAVEDLNMTLHIDDGTSVTSMVLTGYYEYAVTGDETGLGANIHATLVSAEMTDENGTESLDGAEFIIVGDKAYTKKPGQEWVYEELDENALLGLGLILGLSGPTGSGLDLFSDPAIFTVSSAPADQMMGQAMQAQTLTLNLGALLANAEALNAMMTSGFSAGGDALGMSQEDLGVDAAQLAMLSAMLLPMFEGTSFSTTIYIGADDGYIHRVEDNYTFLMDTSALGALGGEEEPQRMEMRYELSGNIVRHNQPVTITAPEGATEGSGLLGEGGGLLGSLGGAP
ncbi:MAG: hypothetical protein Kow00106_22340 [Anaerolineae bacterium]